MSYCSKCGKEIDYDAVVCNECLAKEAAEKEAQAPVINIFEEPTGFGAPEAPANGENTRMRGFGAALTGVILSFVGMIFCIISVADEALYGLVTVGLGMVIASMVLGGISIGRFFSTKREGRPVPIATLIMGIASLAEGAVFFLSLLSTLALIL